jgi:hypothetical protein
MRCGPVQILASLVHAFCPAPLLASDLASRRAIVWRGSPKALAQQLRALIGDGIVGDRRAAERGVHGTVRDGVGATWCSRSGTRLPC